MLNQSKPTSILPVVNLNRAKEFYTGKLGLSEAGKTPTGEILLNAGGTTIALSPRDTPTKAEHTVITFQVDDVKNEVQQLKSRGVKFEEYSDPEFNTVDGVHTDSNGQCAWFKDTEGNILCIHHFNSIN